jgi:hypothetical protein
MAPLSDADQLAIDRVLWRIALAATFVLRIPTA